MKNIIYLMLATHYTTDIFAPVAAHLANGVSLTEMGKRVSPNNLISLPNPQCFLDGQDIWHGEVIHIDHFGNIITSLDAESLKITPSKSPETNSNWVFETGDIKVNSLAYTFSNVNQGDFVAYIGSSGYLEIAMREGNAALEKEIQIGENVYAYKK